MERYRKLSDLPESIPVFPLDGVILLPRSGLPLNIFEPRYLSMLDEVLASDRIIGLIQPKNSESIGDSPKGDVVELRTIGCAGRLTAFQETDDGRLLITLTGICRFRLAEEIEDSNPFRTFRVDYAPFEEDLNPGLGEQEVDREHLLSVLKNYLEINELNADWQSINRSSNEFLVNTLSMISPYGPAEKQALLEAKNLAERSEVLVALAEMELASRDDGSEPTIQ